MAGEGLELAIHIPATQEKVGRNAGEVAFGSISVATVNQRDEEEQRHRSYCKGDNDDISDGASRAEAKTLDEDTHLREQRTSSRQPSPLWVENLPRLSLPFYRATT